VYDDDTNDVLILCFVVNTLSVLDASFYEEKIERRGASVAVKMDTK